MSVVTHSANTGNRCVIAFDFAMLHDLLLLPGPRETMNLSMDWHFGRRFSATLSYLHLVWQLTAEQSSSARVGC